MNMTGSIMPLGPEQSIALSWRLSLARGGMYSASDSHTITRALISSVAPSQSRLLPARDKCLYHEELI